MILHLSDLHFGTEREACLQAIRQLCEEHPFEAVVVSGDLTQRARFIQFYACRQFLDSLQLPYLVVPGIMIYRCTMCGIVFSAPLHVINCFLGDGKHLRN